MSSKNGKFISVEGPDGAGKSTGIRYLMELDQKYGTGLIFTREPGGTHLSEKIRTLLLSEPMDKLTEVLLFNAGRAEHIEGVIAPALAEGRSVITDRWIESSYAYQGYGRNALPIVEDVMALMKKHASLIYPDIMIFFDIPVEVSLDRISSRGGLDRFESEKNDFFKRVNNGYQERLKDISYPVHYIDASRSIEEVKTQLEAFFKSYFLNEGATK